MEGFKKLFTPRFLLNKIRKKQIERLLKIATKKNEQEEVIDYLTSFLNLGKSLDFSNKYIALDTETTSLDIPKAQLLSVGFVDISNDVVLIKSSQEYFVNNPLIEKKDAITIHGIRNKDLELKGANIKNVLLRLLEAIKGKVIVAHHTKFDTAMLNKYLLKYFSIPILNPLLDTALLARQLDRKGLELPPLSHDKYKLDALCQAYRIEQTDRHTSLGDAYATALLFLKLKKSLIERKINLNEQLFYI